MRPLHVAAVAATISSLSLVPAIHAQNDDSCTPSEFTCWDKTVVKATPPKCTFQCEPCPTDTYTCPDGSVVHRDQTRGCNFKQCMQNACDDDTYTCPVSGAIMKRNPAIFCEFDDCPTTCSREYRTCDDGSRVFRNPLNKCQFDLCGGKELCAPDVYECPQGMGYVYRNEDNNCEFFPCAIATADPEGYIGTAGKYDLQRRKAIFAKIAETDASSPAAMFALSPQSVALDWLASADPARLDPDHPALLQRYALAVFFFSTFNLDELGQLELGSDKPISHGWTDESGWMTGAGHCSWHGVQCLPRVKYSAKGVPTVYTTYDDSDMVTHLNLTNNNIRGVLPREFSLFNDLRVLDISQNTINGPIPPRWAGMSNLTVLALQLNRLVGPIPDQLFNCRKLQILNLEYNYLEGTIPNYWHMVPDLRQIRLGLNELNGPIPEQLGALGQLRVLWLDANRLQGTIPESFYFLTNLQSLFLHRNSLTGTLPTQLRGMVQLREMTLSENKLSGPIPKQFEQLTNLYSLYLENNNFVGPIPPELGKLKNLVVLRIFNNDIRGVMPRTICKLRKTPSGQLVWLAADCARAGGTPKVKCGCCDECHG